MRLSLLLFLAAAGMMRPLIAQTADPAVTSPYGGTDITFGELANSSGGA